MKKIKESNTILKFIRTILVIYMMKILKFFILYKIFHSSTNMPPLWSVVSFDDQNGHGHTAVSRAHLVHNIV